MLHRGKRCGEFSSHPLGGRIGAYQVRLFLFQLFKCLVEPIVFRIGQEGIVQDVVTVLMKAQNITKHLDLFRSDDAGVQLSQQRSGLFNAEVVHGWTDSTN